MHSMARIGPSGHASVSAFRLLARQCLLMLLLFGAATLARGAPPDVVPVVTLSPGARGIPLAGQIGVLVDESGELGIEQVRSPEGDQRFRVVPEPVTVGFNAAPRWIKVRLRQDAPSGEWLLALASRNVSDLRFFGPFDDAGGGSLSPPVVTGSEHPYATRFLGYERFSFRIQLPEPGIYTVYLRLQSVFA